ncbi:MAG: hypothetical protein MEQ84_06080 [Mesorhizobium sp.]|nr:hypothetical protein [Mesorhizobium sp.]
MMSVPHDDCLSTEFGPQGSAELNQAIDAVCAELGLATSEHERRRAVKERVLDAYRLGRRQPLYLVSAGLGH